MTRIRTYRILIPLFVILQISGNSWSQNVLHRNNYFIQEYLINPAFTGAKDFNPFYMSYRNQFSQLKERPQVFSASGYFIIDPSSSVAGSLYSSETPSFNQLFGELNYSHDFHFSQWAHFTFGAGLIFNQTSQDFSGVEVADLGDPSLTMGNTSNNVVDGALGVKYFLKRFKTGISVKNILERNISNETSNNLFENKLAREVNFIAQYDFTIDSLLHIEPLFVARRFTQKKENYYNFSVVANYNRLYTLGATYRLNNDLSPNAISLIGGLQYNKFYFLYSHQLFVADADVAGNNTEFTVGYRFPLRPTKVFVDNDLDGVINRKDTCPYVFGPKKYSGCPLEYWAPLLALQKAEADTLILEDSLMFRFDKLSAEQLDGVKLYLIDENGEVIYQAMKNKDGFVFNYLPPTGEYYFRMENIPEEFDFEYVEISFFENENKKTYLAHLTQNNGIYMFSRIMSDTNNVAKLLIINDDDQVLAVGIQKDGVYVFNYLPEDKNYHYSLVESDSTNSEESFHVSYDFEGQEQTIRTVYHKINGVYKYSPHFIENENFDDLVLSFESESEDYIFNFEKLSPEQAEMANLVMVDEEGNVLSTAEKTDAGFVFNKLPSSGKYFYKLENMPEGSDIEFLEVTIIEDGVKKKVVADVDSKEKLVKLDNTNQKIMNSLRALNNENIKSMTKSEARKRGHYLTVQVGAFRYRMNDETLDFINTNYGDDFHIIKDKRLEYDLYMLGRYKTLSDVKEMNAIIKEAGFSDCFIMGVEKKSPASALKIIKSFPGYR